MTEPRPDAAQPDPVVRTALQLLPVPEHHARFWAELDVLLDAAPRPVVPPARQRRPRVDGPVVADAPPHDQVLELVPDSSLALVPPSLRRRSNVLLSAVAVAAAVLVVVAGTTLVRQRAGGEDGTTEVADGAEAARDTLISSTSTSVAEGAGSDPEVPTDAVLAWVDALSTGDTATAWASLGPASKAHFGSQSAFAAEGSALAEGYGAWSAATPDDVVVTTIAGGDGSLVVVTLVGTVLQEGTREHRADAFPVRIVDGSARLEPFAFAGELEIVVPEPVPRGGSRPVVHGDDELVVVVPRGVKAPTIRLDDDEALICGEADGTELAELDDAPGQRCSYRPEGGIRPGTRVLTVAFLGSDGAGIAAESVLFEAA